MTEKDIKATEINNNDKTADVEMQFLVKEAEKSGIVLSPKQCLHFEQFYSLVVEKNKLMNLTSITERKDFFIKHLIDSILPQKFINHSASVLDLGCGGGFPSIPLKIVRPDLNITAMDATNKKVEFVNEAILALELENCVAVTARAEEAGQGKLRSSFDAVVSRAVANMLQLMELALPLVKVGGIFSAYKTEVKEVENIENATQILGSVLESVEPATLPNGDSRCFFLFRKKAEINEKYPRNFGQIKKKPL